MAAPKQSTPTTSSRVAGIIAIIAILLGGYFGFVAKPPQKPEATVASAAIAPDTVEKSAGTATPMAADTPKTLDMPKIADAPKTVDAPKIVDTPKTVDTTKTVNAPKTAAMPDATAPPIAGDKMTAGAPPQKMANVAPPADTSPAPQAATPGSPPIATAPNAGNAPPSAKEPAPAVAAPMKEAALPKLIAPATPSVAAAAPSAAPSFDVVRVEPSGSTVVAGQAEPKAKVELLDGSAAIASADANDRGEWAMVLDKPLTPGPHDLSIRTTSPDKKTEALSEQHVAIDVPALGKSEPLVVLDQPDAPSRVIQKPAAEAAPDKKIASVETPPPAAPAPMAPGQTADAAPRSTAPPAPPAPNAPNAMAAAPDNAAPAPPASGQNPPAAAPSADAAPALPNPAIAAPAANTGGDQKAAAVPAPAPSDSNVAAKTPPAATPPAEAGAKPADDTKLALDSKPSENAKPAPGAMASTEPAKPAAPVTPALADQAFAPPPAADKTVSKAEPPKASQPVIAPKVTVEAVEFENGKLFVAGGAATGETVRVYLDDVVVGEAKPGDGGRWLLETQHDVAPGRHSVRADQLGISGEVVVRAEVPFDRTEDVAELAPVTAGASAAGASANGAMPPVQTVIIRRGDNLWRISRRLYGRGIHYSTIYQANDEQIRNPHWIYPGQVFTLPIRDAGGRG